MTRWLCALLTLGCLALAPGASHGQSYPAKPIRIVVPVAPGGVTDVLARTLGQRFTDAWGQQIIVENKPGASNQIGAEFVAKSPPDGYTLLVAPEQVFVSNPSLYSKLPYDPVKDFTPITSLVSINQALVVHPSLAVGKVSDLIALAKQKPGELNYGTFGIGSASHLNMEMLQSMARVKFVPVHYRGAAPALTDVIAGHIPMVFVAVGLVLEPWRAGQVKLLAVGSSKRLAQFPDLPTVAESGLPGFEARGWFGLFAPSGTPREVVARINAEVQRIFADPAFQERFLAPQMLEPSTSSPEQFAAHIQSETEKWSKVIRDAQVRID